ncbi:hypothetical protein C8R46DRAFT_1228474 [Mycena filopes]|nr:hypothetical protein C8R46DRAFT_1228474 [Mycena filopes]
MRTTVTSLLIALTLPGSAFCTTTAASNASFTPCGTPHPASPREQQAIFEKYTELLYVKRAPVAAYAYIPANQIQHNPYTLDGAAASFPVVNSIIGNSSLGVQVLHQAFAAPFGWVYWRLDGFYPAPAALLDLYRFEGGCILEHWDITQAVPADAINPHALF